MRARALAVHACLRARVRPRRLGCSRSTRRQRGKVDKCRVADKKQTDRQTNKHTLLFYRYRRADQGRLRPKIKYASAHAVQLLNEKIAALHAFQKQNRTRACCRIRSCRDFQKKGKRKPTCHFPSSVYSLPSLGVFTFRIVLNRILHKSSLLAPMESRRTRRPTFTAEEARAKKRARPPATCRKSVAVSLPEIFRGVNLLAD